MNRNPVYRFAKKKMKRITSLIFAMTIGLSCLAQNKSCIGIDAGSMIRGCGMNISAGYGFCMRWSVSWKAELNADIFKGRHDQEYMEHSSEFDAISETKLLPYGNSIMLQYWPDSIYKGAWLETGCRCTLDKLHTDCVIGAGYMIPVWRGLKASLSYQMSMLESLQESKLSGTGLTIGIYWTITHGNHGKI